MSDANGGAATEEPAGPKPRFKRTAERPTRAKATAQMAPTTAVWREQALVDIAAAQLLADRLRTTNGSQADARVLDGVDDSLSAARDAALGGGMSLRERIVAGYRGAGIERAWGQIDAAQEGLLRIADDAYVRGQLPRILARARRALTSRDPRRIALEDIVEHLRGNGGGQLDPVDREVIGTVFHATNAEARRNQTRVRSFRNVLMITSLLLWLAVAGLASFGFSKPALIPLCFNPAGHVVCPTREAPAPVPQAAATEKEAIATQAKIDEIQRRTVSGWDVFLIELVGLIAAAVAGAASLRDIRGTSTPYSVPVALAVLKLPTGALTAVLGLLLMRGEFVPGLSALDFPAQIVAWAVIFGYAQQLFTRFVDRQAQTVLENATPGQAPATADVRHPRPATT